MSTDPRTHRAWIEVQASSLRRNFRRVREAVGPGIPVLAMVKADAYGLGLREVVETLRIEAPEGWGVATVAEGRALGALGVEGPIVVFSPLIPADLPAAVEADLTVCVSSLEGLDAFAEAARRVGRTASFQVEVDTGMGRAGFDDRAVHEWGPEVRRPREGLRWTGLFTHFHSADAAGGVGVEEQLARFQRVREALDPPEDCRVHEAASAAAFRLGARAAGARPGIFLYGGGIGPDLPSPEPVVALRARVVHVRDAAPGATVGYGATWTAREPERWATLAAGYGDGLPRALGNRGAALVAGRRVPLVGRVSMDLAVAIISGLDGVQPGDIATLIGRDGDAEITVDEVAECAGTIPYEVLTGLSPRLPRVWIR